MAAKFVYIVEGHKYVLRPKYHLSPRHRVYIEGAEIYDLAGVYLGYWDRYNIPMKLIGELCKWVRSHLLSTPTRTPLPPIDFTPW